MSLIQCPECKKEISDKSAVCIYCGYPLTGETSPQQVEITSINIRSKTAGKIVFISIVAMIALTGIFFSYKKLNEFELEKLIVQSFVEIEIAAYAAEYITSRTYETWSSAIRSGSDFNGVLDKLYKEKSMKYLINNVSDAKNAAELVYAKSLKFGDANVEMYKNYKELYDQFNKVARFSSSPEGSLQSYGQEKRKIFEDYKTLHDRLKPILHTNIMTMSFWDWLKMKYF